MKRKILSLIIVFAMIMSLFTTVVLATDTGTVLYDKNGIKITYQNYTVTNYGYFDINLLIENNSSEHICVQARSESINGYMISAIMSDEVQIGKKAYANLSFSDYSLKENYISTIYDVQFSFHIFKASDYDTIDDSPLINLSFNGVELYNDVPADTRPITTFYNKDGIKISYIEHVFDEYGYLTVKLLIENNSGKYICVQARNESINGFMISAIMSNEVQIGKKAYADMSFSDYSLDGNNISSVNEIEFSMHIFETYGMDTIDDSRIYKIVNGGVQGFTATPNPNTPATQGTPSVTTADNEIKVVINGEKINFDVQPQLINNRTMVPLRAIFEALGATVDWNGDTQTVTSSKGSTTISLTINNPTMYVNGTPVALDSPACLVGGRTLVPVRAISEAFGTTVDWDGTTSTVSVSTPILYSEPGENGKKVLFEDMSTASATAINVRALKNALIKNGIPAPNGYVLQNSLGDTKLSLTYMIKEDLCAFMMTTKSNDGTDVVLILYLQENKVPTVTISFNNSYVFIANHQQPDGTIKVVSSASKDIDATCIEMVKNTYSGFDTLLESISFIYPDFNKFKLSQFGTGM